MLQDLGHHIKRNMAQLSDSCSLDAKEGMGEKGGEAIFAKDAIWEEGADKVSRQVYRRMFEDVLLRE